MIRGAFGGGVARGRQLGGRHGETDQRIVQPLAWIESRPRLDQRQGGDLVRAARLHASDEILRQIGGRAERPRPDAAEDRMHDRVCVPVERGALRRLGGGVNVQRQAAARGAVEDRRAQLGREAAEGRQRVHSRLDGQLDAGAAERGDQVELGLDLRRRRLRPEAGPAVAAGRPHVRAGGEEARSGVPGREPGLDVARDGRVDAGVQYGRHAAGDVGAEVLAVELPQRIGRVVAEGAAGRGDEVDVGIDQPRQHRGAGGVEHRSVAGGEIGTDRGDAPVANEDGDVVARRRAGAVDQPRIADEQRGRRTGQRGQQQRHAPDARGQTPSHGRS